ncbi:hypothetical protein C8F01DRAFT_1329677 [Mycena amicta]|nr:hypothetical protein C8F01DRAFT_1329677 [Mycena amicta]
MGKRQSTKKKAAKPSTQLQKDSAETLKRIRAEAKAAEKKLGSAQSKQKKQAPTVVQRPAPRPKLTIRLPKATTEPENALAASGDETAPPANVQPGDVIRGDTLPPSSPPAGSDIITPPPKIPAKLLDATVREYLSKHGLLDDTVDIDLAGSESEEDNSETEEFLRTKGGVFSEGIETKDGSGTELGEGEGEDEYESDADADEYEEEEALSLRFSVPVDGADKSLDVTSTTTFAALRTKLANTMDVSPKSVYVATRFSTQPRSTSFTHLTDDESLRALFAAARRHIGEIKNKKTKTSKEFYVEVKDLGAAKKAKEEKEKGKEKKEKEKKNKRKHNASDSDEEEAHDAVADAAVGEKKQKKKSATQWAVVIEQDNHCAEHGGHGCIRRKDKYGNEIHEQLEKKDIGSWSILKAAGYPSTTIPPPQLKIAQKSTAPLPPAPAPTLAPAPAPAPMSAPMSMLFTPPYGFHPGMMPGPMMPPYMYHPSMPQNYNRHHRDFPSSDPIEEDDPTIFPYISDWLEELDGGIHGDGHGFAQYADEFSSRQLKRLDDLLNVTEDTLLAYGIPKGTAQKMRQYAEKDVKVIRKRQGKRARTA